MISIVALALVSFNIPEGPADDAMRQFVAQVATWSAIYESGRLNGFKTKAVVGEHEPSQAIRLLLEGSNLTYSMTTSRWVSVIPLRHPAPRRRTASITRERVCDCLAVDRELGATWCTWRDEGTLGVRDDCRKRGANAQ
jgi:hypothetical protein